MIGELEVKVNIVVKQGGTILYSYYNVRVKSSASRSCIATQDKFVINQKLQ